MNQDPTKPVAYDVHGRPLYAAPQVPTETTKDVTTTSYVTAAEGTNTSGQNFDPQFRAQESNEPKIVHTTRPIEPKNKVLSEAVQQRCHESRTAYPHLNLSDGEFIILDIKRHPIGLFLPIFATAIALILLSIVFVVYPSPQSALGASIPSFGSIVPILVLLMVLVGLGGFVAVWVYLQNQFYLTNESVIQEIQHGLFSRDEQSVSLGSIEDASFRQIGVLQNVLNYGSVRLSTEGDETTYRFSYVSDPRSQIAKINNAIEAFKNGRPVDPYEN